MKVLFKIKEKVETISNVSVDDKCFPLVGGLRPFSASSKSKSPLALESSLWFKTLAVDSLFVDCDAGVIYWSPISNDHISEEVKLRKKDSHIPLASDFISEDAKPLVSDYALFDFDASYREMIIKSLEVAKKLISKLSTTNDVNLMVANLLHVYILPAITFSRDDLYALSRARCLIEERLLQADADIATKAKAINLLQSSLENLKDNLLLKDDFESESYLKSCNVKFLKAFLTKIEEDSLKLNLDLEAQQSKVNWAKEHNYDKREIVDFQKKRDALFRDVEKLIKVREALKNVVSRKAKTKKKKARQEILDSCFHNVFLEILRRLEIENKTIQQLVEDKLNISATREAIMAVILDLDDHERDKINSDRSTRFEPISFGDFHMDGNIRIEKSDDWLTLQERVSKILKDPSSRGFQLHVTGCNEIRSKIDLALSEFNLHASCKNQPAEVENIDLDDAETSEKENVMSLLDNEGFPEKKSVTMNDLQLNNGHENSLHAVHCEAETSLKNSEEKEKDVSLRSNPRLGVSSMVTSQRSGQVFDVNTWQTPEAMKIPISTSETENNDNACLVQDTSTNDQEDLMTEAMDDVSLDFIIIESAQSGETIQTPVNQNQRHFISENLAINSLMKAVEEITMSIRQHFKEMVRCLQEHLNPDSMDQYEILWKAYERHFSEEVLLSLSVLYEAMLEPGSLAVYEEICKTSIQELLEGDKILTLLYKSGGPLSNVSFERQQQAMTYDAISMAKTTSELSLDVRHYSVDVLYKLANADSEIIRHQFRLGSDEPSDEFVSGSPGSSESGASVKTSDLFQDDDEGISHSNASSSHSSKSDNFMPGLTNAKTNTLESHQSLSSASDEGREGPHNLDIKSSPSDLGCDLPPESQLYLNQQEVYNILEPVLSPFRKQIIKCMKARSVLDKMRYLSKGVQCLNNDISLLYGADHVSACDDVLSMLVLSLSNMSEDIFVGLYSNLRLLMDILPSFLSGTLCDFNLVSLCAAYDFLLNRNVCQRVVKRYSNNFKVKCN